MQKNKEILEKRMKVAYLIREARKSKGLTQKSLAEKCNYTKGTILRVEAGAFSPNADQLYNICKILELPIKIGDVVL